MGDSFAASNCSDGNTTERRRGSSAKVRCSTYIKDAVCVNYIRSLNETMETIKKMYMSAKTTAVGSGSEETMDAAQQFGQTGPPPPLSQPPPMAAVDPDARSRYLAMKRARVPDEDHENEDKSKQAKQAKRKSKDKANKHLIQKTTFKAIINELIGSEMNVSADACRILHNEGEKYLSSIFENAGVLSRLNGRKTVSLADIHGVLALQCPNFADKVAILRKSKSFMDLSENSADVAVDANAIVDVVADDVRH